MSDVSQEPPARKPVLPPAYFGLAILLMFLLHYLAPLARIISSSLGLGIGLIALGLFVALAGRLQFKWHDTTVKPFQESSALVTVGVYRITRNPMYLGMVLFLTGIATAMGTLTPFLVIPLFAALINTRFILREERHLTEQFGQEYEDYRKRVRRWI